MVVVVVGCKDVRWLLKVLLPFLNTPATIRGAYAVLVDMLGKEEAAEIIEKNPGVLSCDPDELVSTLC